MQKKKIVWDLFGGGQNSVFLTLQELNLLKDYDVYTFDITEPIHDKQFKIDLAQDNIIKIFSQFPKPDIIVASPLCQSFSCVLNMKGGGTCFWKFNNAKTKLIERSVKEFETLKSGFTKNLKADVQLFIKRLGQKCIDNTIALIKHYQPQYWYIENPKQSLMWKYIQLNRSDFFDPFNHYLNETSYGKYGYFTTKATIFLSNVPMNLLKGKIDPPYTIETINGQKYYVLKDDAKTKVRFDLDSRMLGLASINKMIKARNVKSGMGAMDFIQRQSSPYQKNKKTNEQISESGPASAIPHPLIAHIFSYFNFKSSKINLITLIKQMIDTSNPSIFHQLVFIIYGLLWNKYQINAFDPKFAIRKSLPVEIDLQTSFNQKAPLVLKKFDLWLTNEQIDFIKLIIKEVLKKSLPVLTLIINKNPWWDQQVHSNSKINKIANDKILASFNDLAWIKTNFDLKF